MEPVFVVLIVFSSMLIFMKMVLDFRRSKLLHEPGHGASLGTTELKRLIREAVEEAVVPLSDRMDRLENRLPAHETPLLESPADEAEKEHPAHA